MTNEIACPIRAAVPTMVPPDRRASIEKYRRRARGYDRLTGCADPYRRRLVERLDLRPGDVVLDVGCGTGLSFRFLEERLGPEGRVIGVDLSPDMVARARERLQREGWRNVTLIQSSAEEAEIPEPADAVLFSITHDILRSPAALQNVFAHVKPGGRVAAGGVKWAPSRTAFVNPLVWWRARRYVTTFEGFERPWSLLAHFIPNLEVEPIALGAAYLAWGTADAEGGGPEDWSAS